MDKLIYTAGSGAKHTLEQQANVSNNLANASTTGFRAQLNTFRSVPIVGDGLNTRAFVVDADNGTDFSGGPMQQTGRTLDLAVQGPGWLAVQAADGTEAYTRAGDLKTDENGLLQTQSGQNVMGETGPITIPPNVVVTVANDGTISTVPTDGLPNNSDTIGRLKLVNPDQSQLTRGDDGLFRLSGGTDANADATVTVASGMLEGSNVNPIESMVSIINLSRQFDLHMKMLTTQNADEAKSTSIMTL
ncbi:MAG: flgF [Herbaspirillum sp.]|jgi:flagellar basal-body rod protein FlgF|nr:flgF [Herbaspirillum sp.]